MNLKVKKEFDMLFGCISDLRIKF